MSEEKVYGLTLAPALGTYDSELTPDLSTLLAETPDKGIAAEIHLVGFDSNESTVMYRWLNERWCLDEMVTLDDDEKALSELRAAITRSKKRPTPDPFAGPNRIKQIILDDLGLGGSEDTLLATFRVRSLTFESKAKAGEYQNEARGYLQLEPENLRLHIPIYNAMQEINDGGNLDLLGKIVRRIGRELDMQVAGVARDRVDCKTERADKEAQSGVRLKTKRKEVHAQPKGEVL